MNKRPFAAVLVGPDHETVLLTHQSVDHVNHAEASLARMGACHYTQEYLWTCTLYSTWVCRKTGGERIQVIRGSLSLPSMTST